MAHEIDSAVIEAAGGVVECDSPHGPLIVVAYRERHGAEWVLPKGKRQTGESWQQTALREVEEEIGVKPAITGLAGATAYVVGGVPKLVLYWRMRAEPNRLPFTPNDEVKEIAWLAPQKAIERLAHSEEANLVRAMIERHMLT